MKAILFILILSVDIFSDIYSRLVLTRTTHKIYLDNEYVGKKIHSQYYEKEGVLIRTYSSKDDSFFIILELHDFIDLIKKMKSIFSKYDEVAHLQNEWDYEKNKENEIKNLFRDVFFTLNISHKDKKITFSFSYKKYGEIILKYDNEIKTFNEYEFFKFISSLFPENVEKFLNLWKCDCEYFFNENGDSICNDEACNNYKYEEIFIPCEKSEEIATGIECPKKPENAIEKIRDNMQVIYYKK